ncbi:hypothetical protein [Aureibacter tunicatorum]|uniref:Uncharacterized protein n=1 Tax=Aureibacter tunicatorum TaxID=866807 RepID=A0AAE3XRQ0_9BACT|nr:hypothetical protein [Aureibacter tunicatorum]MDR6240676.1 hypothetical protein [Aureibacter tunicatorum]BDD06991.1 hypothetical protein AUTU_44740 [Aureibacter tunicatorum]
MFLSKKAGICDGKFKQKDTIQMFKKVKGGTYSLPNSICFFDELQWNEDDIREEIVRKRRLFFEKDGAMHVKSSKSHLEKRNNPIEEIGTQKAGDLPDLLVSDGGELAIVDTPKPRMYYATPENIEKTNRALNERQSELSVVPQAKHALSISSDSEDKELIAVMIGFNKKVRDEIGHVSQCTSFALHSLNATFDNALAFVYNHPFGKMDQEHQWTECDVDGFCWRAHSGALGMLEHEESDFFGKTLEDRKVDKQSVKSGFVEAGVSRLNQQFDKLGLNQYVRPRLTEMVMCNGFSWTISDKKKESLPDAKLKKDEAATDLDRRKKGYAEFLMEKHLKKMARDAHAVLESSRTRWNRHAASVLAMDGDDWISLESTNFFTFRKMAFLSQFDKLLIKHKGLREALDRYFGVIGPDLVVAPAEKRTGLINEWVKNKLKLEKVGQEVQEECELLTKRFEDLGKVGEGRFFFLSMYGRKDGQSFHERVSPMCSGKKMTFRMRRSQEAELEELKYRMQEQLIRMKDVHLRVDFKDKELNEALSLEMEALLPKYESAFEYMNKQVVYEDALYLARDIRSTLKDEAVDILRYIFSLFLRSFGFSTEGVETHSYSKMDTEIRKLYISFSNEKMTENARATMDFMHQFDRVMYTLSPLVRI